MVSGKKCGYFRLGIGPKFDPWRRAENPLYSDKGLRTANGVSVSNNSFQFQITPR